MIDRKQNENVRNRPVTEELRELIFEQFVEGKSVAELASQFHRAEGTIRRLVNLQRAEQLAALPLDYIPSKEFEMPGAAAEILASRPRPSKPARRVSPPKGLPAYLAALYETPLLTRDEEFHLFRKYNFLKHRACELRDALDVQRPKAKLLDEIEKRVDEAEDVKQLLVKSNMRLVVSVAKRYVTPGRELSELVSDGNVSLIRAVEKFDYSRGFKFSTYATWAIVKNFARSLPAEKKLQTRFKTSHDERLDAESDYRSDQAELEHAQDRREWQVNRILRYLNDREQQIIAGRFGLQFPHKRQTLKEIGEDLGVSKERIRQLEQRAMNKLREAARDEDIKFD